MKNKQKRVASCHQTFMQFLYAQTKFLILYYSKKSYSIFTQFALAFFWHKNSRTKLYKLYTVLI